MALLIARLVERIFGFYRHDGIAYFSRKPDLLPARSISDEFVASVLRPEYPLAVVVHDEAGSQVRNPFEQALIEPVIRVLADQAGYALNADDGLGIVVPHRAQRAARKMVLVASRSVFSLFSPDEETFTNSLLWKNLLLRTCSTLLWEGEREGKRVGV
jgi:hypothetical protein